jgi:hypothetical protein
MPHLDNANSEIDSDEKEVDDEDEMPSPVSLRPSSSSSSGAAGATPVGSISAWRNTGIKAPSTSAVHLSSAFLKEFHCPQFIDIDEQSIPWKGRHKCRCYNPPEKFHFKIFALNDAHTHTHTFPASIIYVRRSQ